MLILSFALGLFVVGAALITVTNLLADRTTNQPRR